MQKSNVEILSGQDAREQLADADFRREWMSLHAACPWATSMQSLTFVAAWYDFYGSEYEPVIAAARDAENKLAGLLPLAVERSGSARLVVAGDYLCEYGTWLAPTAADGNRFIAESLTALAEKFPNAVLQFLYLAAATPLEWLNENEEWKRLCVLRPVARPLLLLGDGSRLQKILDKKSNRSRLKQMSRAGAIELARVTDASEFEAIFDRVKTFADLRLSAVHRVVPKPDAGKKSFYVELFKANLLHVTLLKVGGEIASAHFNTYNRDEVFLGVTALSPFFAKNSPSKFHITMLGLELVKSGVETFDLTPGGAYKDRHANGGDEVHVLTIYFNRASRRRFALKRQAGAAAKKVLELAKIDRENLDERLHDARHKLKFATAGNIVAELFAKARSSSKRKREARIYSFDAEKIASLPNPNLMKRDCLEDLLKYEPTASRHLTASAFHSLSIDRLSEGNHVYTRVEAGKLAHCGWLAERAEKTFVSEANQSFSLPPDSAVLFDFFASPQAVEKGFYEASIRQMLHDAARSPNLREVYIFVSADDDSLRRATEKIGFEYKSSIFG